jgi:Fe-S-cluster containining protein
MPPNDELLVQIIDHALADAAKRAGHYLVCRPGCAQCCIGAFSINALDADRLRRGYAALAVDDPDRFARIKHRIAAYVTRTAADFPGDPVNGALDESEDGQARFEDFANDEACPVLDPATSTCDLYEYRPMTCRVFGPPVRAVDASEDSGEESVAGLGVCELCFIGASEQEIAACELIADPDNLEDTLLDRLAAEGNSMSTTTVAYALSTADAGVGDKGCPPMESLR